MEFAECCDGGDESGKTWQANVQWVQIPSRGARPIDPELQTLQIGRTVCERGEEMRGDPMFKSNLRSWCQDVTFAHISQLSGLKK